MIRKIVLFLFSIFLFNTYVAAQSSFCMSLEINNDYYRISDPGAELRKTSRINAIPGIGYRYQFKNNNLLYTGFHFKYYRSSLSFNRFNFSIVSSDNVAIELPILIGKKFSFLKNKVSVSPMFGGAFNLLFFDQSSYSSGGSSVRNFDTLYFSRTSGAANKKYFVTVSFGVNFEFRIWKTLSSAVFFQWRQGFAPAIRQTIKYHINTNPAIIATQTNYGNSMTVLGLRIFLRKISAE